MIKISLSASEKKFVRFLIAGAINTIFGLAIYSICIISDIIPWLALLISMFIGMAFNFLTLGSYAFQAISLGRLPRFVIFYTVTYIINLTLLMAISTWLNNKILSQAIISIPVALVSYYFINRFVFYKKY